MEVQRNSAISAVVHTSSRLAAAEFMVYERAPSLREFRVSHVSIMLGPVTLSKPWIVVFNCRSIFHYYIRLDVHDLNSTIVSLPGNLRVPTKDKEKNLEVRFEKKGKKGENDVEKGKAEPTVDEACWIHEQLKSASCILRLLELWMNLFLGALHRTKVS